MWSTQLLGRKMVMREKARQRVCIKVDMTEIKGIHKPLNKYYTYEAPIQTEVILKGRREEV